MPRLRNKTLNRLADSRSCSASRQCCRVVSDIRPPGRNQVPCTRHRSNTPRPPTRIARRFPGSLTPSSHLQSSPRRGHRLARQYSSRSSWHRLQRQLFFSGHQVPQWASCRCSHRVSLRLSPQSSLRSTSSWGNQRGSKHRPSVVPARCRHPCRGDGFNAALEG